MSVESPTRTENISKIVEILTLLSGHHMKWVAEVIEMSPATVTRRSQGTGSWSADDLDKLAEKFDVPITTFFMSPQAVWDFLASTPAQGTPPDGGDGGVTHRKPRLRGITGGRTAATPAPQPPTAIPLAS